MTNILGGAFETAVPNVSINPQVDINDIIALPEVPCQREHERRVSKMGKHFQKDTSSKHTFTVFNITKNFKAEISDQTVTVKKGCYLADGNTRVSSLKQKKGYDTKHPVITHIVDVSSEKQMFDEYYSIDSSSATETSPDKIRGAIKMLKLKLTSQRALSGAYASALNYAYPDSNENKARVKVAYFKDELELLDKCGIFEPTTTELIQQHFFCMCLIVSKLYSEPGEVKIKLEETLKSLARLDVDVLKTESQKWSGVTALIHQAVRPNEKFNAYDPEFHKASKYASFDPVLSFMLYCFEMQMNDKTIDKVRGFKPSSWKNKFENTKDLIEKNYPLS
jgi:hypothetical protein